MIILILDYNVLLNAPNLFKQLKMDSNKTFFIISLDNLMSMGKRLRATIYKINKTFSECDFMLCDTVNRFNIMMLDKNLSEKEATQIALQNGNDWLQNNQKILSELTIPSKIIRWNKWLEHEDFTSKLKIIETEYNNNLECKNAFDKTAKVFLSRRGVELESNLNQCIMYLQEECAVMLLWADYGYNFELYTSKRNHAMEYTYQKLIKDNYPPNIMVPVIVDVKHKTKKEQEIINIAFNQILNLDFGHIYVKDEEGNYLYCNVTQAKSLGIETKDIIGKTDYDFFTKEQADKYKEVDSSVIKTGKINVSEEEWQHNGYKIFLSTKYPLFGNDNKVIGILGISIDITAQKQVDKLKSENEKYKIEQQTNVAIVNEHMKFNKFIDEIQRSIKAYQSSLLNSKIDKKINFEVKEGDSFPEIKLTEREQTILYFLSLNKPAKEIAKIISTIENKIIEPSTVASVINKQLYSKLNVFNTSELIEKASLYKLLPFMPDSFLNKTKKKI